jgi:predicted nucleic acid-binding protein
MPSVVDASVVLAWCLADEISEYADRVLATVAVNGAVVPGIWPVEVANGLVVAERRRRLTEAQVWASANLVRSLPVEVRQIDVDSALGSALDLSRSHDLSLYDAAYLDLAMREGLPLATQDSRLSDAAKAVGVALVE